MQQRGGRLNAFSSASAQAAVLKEWQQKNAKRQEETSSLRRKVNQLRSDAESVRKVSRWLQERDALNDEQEACEAALDTQLTALKRLAEDPDHAERLAELGALRVTLARQLEEAAAFTHTPHGALPQSSERRASEQRITTSLGEWVSRELVQTQEAARALSAASARDASSSAREDFERAASTAVQRLERLCALYHPSQNLRDIFTSTLTGAGTDALARIEETGSTATPVTARDVLATVELIVKMGHQARRFDLTAATSASLTERVTAVFPDLTLPQAHAAIEEANELRRAHAFAKAAVADYQRTIAWLLAACESAFAVAQEAEAARIEKAEAAQLREEEQLQRHARLAEKRVSYEAEVRKRQGAAEQRKRDADAKQRLQQVKRVAEFQERLRLYEVYMAQQAALRQKERELADVRARAAEEDRAARMKRNTERVNFRRNEEEQRRREQREREQEVRALEAQKQQALERFFAAVDKQLGVESDPQRILKPTTSSAQTESYETLAQTTRPSITGFSDEQIMKDPRVRLYHALLAAGLHTTPYGREVATRGYRVSPAQMSSEGNPLRGDFS